MSEEYEFKLSVPLGKRDTRFPIKYEVTREDYLFKFPVVSRRVAEQILKDFDLKEKSTEPFDSQAFWMLMRTAKVPLVITEGHKKALSILSAGIGAVALNGSCRAFTVKEVDGVPELVLRDEVAAVLSFSPRDIYIHFDSDADEKLRHVVRTCTLPLARAAQRVGHNVRIVVNRDYSAKGADDYIVKYGRSAYKELLTHSLTIEEFIEQESPGDYNKYFKQYLRHRKLKWPFYRCGLSCRVQKFAGKSDGKE